MHASTPDHPLEARFERAPTPGQLILAQALLDQKERRCATSYVDTRVYTSTARFADEQQHIFRRVPVPLAPSALLPQAGMAAAHSEYGIPLLLTRDSSGRIRLFLNTCRHRGAQLVDSREAVNKARITCPYHAWTFQLDGSLAGMPLPETFSCLDKKDFGLLEFPAHESGGMIWGILNREGAADFASVSGELADDFTALGFREMHLYARKVHELQANWKFVLDAFQELYHVPVLHAKSVAGMFAASITTENQIGQHTRFATARKDYRNMDLSASVQKLQHHITYSYLVFPNTIVVVSPTFMNILISYPQAVDRTLVEDIMIVTKLPETEAEHDHWRRSWELLDGNVYQLEDLRAAALQQKGLASGHLPTVVLNGLELPIRTFHDNLESYLPPL